MFLEVLGGLMVGAVLFGVRREQRSTVYIEREPEVRLPVYHPPLLPRVPSQQELASIKHGHIFCPINLRCVCGMGITKYMINTDQELCPLILRPCKMEKMKVIDIAMENMSSNLVGVKLRSIYSKDLKSKIYQVERAHGVEFDHVLFDTNRIRFFFKDKERNFANIRQAVLRR